jgi:hypothetical protein
MKNPWEFVLGDMQYPSAALDLMRFLEPRGPGRRSIFNRAHQDRSKYMPHQGERETARRRKQLAALALAASLAGCLPQAHTADRCAVDRFLCDGSAPDAAAATADAPAASAPAADAPAATACEGGTR